ncbi:MAG: glycoside hydrolase family 104 protein [Pseudanabaenaceae cyanobacterium]
MKPWCWVGGGVLALGLTWGWGAQGAIAQGCFMQLSSGQYIDLNDLCAKNPLPPPPAPRPAARPRSEVRPRAAAPTYTPMVFPPSSRNLQAFLQVIRYAEGTDSADGYQIAFTGRRFAGLQDHPRTVHCSGRLCSSAAGAYQFLETTWDSVAAAIGASDFRPEWQDRAAIELIRRRGALEDIEAGRIETAIAKLAPEWASFPRWWGDTDGAYGQSVVDMGTLLAVFQQRLAGGGYSQPSRYLRLSRP